MKTFDSIKTLLEYCQTCPSCKESRKIEISIGPDEYFKMIDWIDIKYQSKIQIECKYVYHNKKSLPDNYNTLDLQSKIIMMPTFIKRHKAKFLINCIDNTYEVSLPETEAYEIEEIFFSLNQKHFMFFIHANCACLSSVDTLDLEFDPDLRTIFNIGIEQESFYLTRTSDKFHVSFHHDDDKMQITRMEVTDENELIDNSDVIKLPAIKLNFDDEQATVDKIRLMLTFS